MSTSAGRPGAAAASPDDTGCDGRVRLAAAVFDLDGVVTLTANVHRAAWKDVFDAYLRARAARSGEPFQPFTDTDYAAYVDGRPRRDGIRAFLASRGITLPEGSPSDPAGAETVHGLAERKNRIFRERLRTMGVTVDREAVRFARELRAAGMRVGMASSSRNAARILEAAGLEDLFDARVDGVLSDELGLRGKPEPDIFLECLRRLGAPDPGRALLVEDSVAGVEAGRRGGFALVIGVDRGGNAAALRAHGAHLVVRDFGGLTARDVAC
jgi:alpha,alpha-trehalase